jgi:predicted amidophosphoribosyltransferase
MEEDPPPGKPSPWARGVRAGTQVLICPSCQREHPAWTAELESCPRCGYPKLAIKLGFRVCSRCGNSWEASDEAAG